MPDTVTEGLREAAADLACRDDLTGLFNRRLLSRLLEGWWEELAAAHGRVSVIMIDLDRFKEVNDTYGHLSGDGVLRATADVLRHHFRSDDIVVRYGGDEFVVVLPGVRKADAGRLGERARIAMAELAIEPVAVPVSFSIGVASGPEDGSTGEEVLAEADRRLFADKRRRHPGATGAVALAPPAWRRAGPWLGLAALAVAVAAAVTLGVRSPASVPGGADGERPEPTVAPPAPAGGREAELLAEIARLESRLAPLLSRTPGTAGGAAGGEQATIDTLRDQIRGLEEQLREREGGAAPAAVPTATAEPETGPQQGGQGTVTAAQAPSPDTGAAPAEQAPVLQRPVLVSYDRPRYPEFARRFRREAAVELRVLVDTGGRVVRVEPTGPPAGFGFDEAAHRAALSALFSPATRAGAPVATETTLTIEFRLGRER